MDKSFDLPVRGRRMKTVVYALYHESRTIPLGVFESEALAFKAMDFYLPHYGGKFREFDVVEFKVLNEENW